MAGSEHENRVAWAERNGALLISALTMLLSTLALIFTHYRWSIEQSRQEERFRVESERSARVATDSSYHQTLSELSSVRPETRLAGLHASRLFADEDRYRDSIRAATLAALRRTLMDFAARGSITLADVYPLINAAAASLTASRDCRHLRETIGGLSEQITTAGLRMQDIEPRVGTREFARKAPVIRYVRDTLGAALFCAYFADCATEADVSSGIGGGSSTGLHIPGLRGIAVAPATIPPDAIPLLGAYPPMPFVGPAHPVMGMLTRCSERDRAKVIDRACPAEGDPAGLKGGGVCSVLRSADFRPGMVVYKSE